MQFTPIQFNSPEYISALALRNKVLRLPLGLTLNEADTLGEDKQLHFAILNNTQLIACIIAKEVSPNTLKLRQMAVDENFRGLGVGRFLMRQIEQYALNKNFQHITLNARISAVEFYRKLGYIRDGELFIEVTIEHVTMCKLLKQS